MVLALRLRRRRHLAGLPIPRSSCAARRFSAAVTTSMQQFSVDAGEDKMTLEVSKVGGSESGVETGAVAGTGATVWLEAHGRAYGAGRWEERSAARACLFCW